MEHKRLPLEQSAPICGVISHYYLNTLCAPSMTPILQTLAILEVTAEPWEDGNGFLAKLEDFKQYVPFDTSTILRSLSTLEEMGIIVRWVRPFHPTVFWVEWQHTLLGEEGAEYLHKVQSSTH